MEEIFDVVDEQGVVRGTATRRECHSNPALIHQVIHLHVFDAKNRLFLQKRSRQKELLPGYWDTAVGGHINSKESIRTGLMREAKEELGIDAGAAQYLYHYLWHGICETEYVHSFKLIFTGTFRLQADEVEDGRFFTRTEIESQLGKNVLTPNFEYEYSHFLENMLK